MVHLGALLAAVVGTMVSDGLTVETAAATLFASLGVLLSFVVPIPMDRNDGRAFAALIGGIAFYTAAMALTGGIGSAFVLMPLATIFLAAIAGGAASAAPVTILGVGGVLLATWISGAEATVNALVGVPAIYVITAIAFSEIQRALQSESERAQDLALATTASAHRRARMEETHELLEDLLSIATSPDINAVAASQDALRGVGLVLPESPARITGPGSTVLARRGEIPSSEPSDAIPIVRSGQTLAILEIWHAGAPLTPSQRTAVESNVTSVGLALENDAMVQRLAGLTIQRERVRLARELHDDIAPSIASVGLALDMVMLGGDLNEDQERTLDATRSNVTRLVDRVRDRVQDLRADRSVSVVERAHTLVAEVDADGPTVVVDIEERTPPRPAIATEVGALMTEAFRNALTHAGASVIRISGRIDDATGVVRVEDNGDGFDHEDPADGHYGLVGMQERANLIGATLEVHTTPGEGTLVEVAWEDSR